MHVCCVLSPFSRVQLFVTPWTVATKLLCPWDFPGKNTGVDCHFLLQGIFPTQGSNQVFCGSCIACGFFTTLSHWGSPCKSTVLQYRIFFFFKFYFIFKLNITVLDLPNIKMNPPQVYIKKRWHLKATITDLRWVALIPCILFVCFLF